MSFIKASQGGRLSMTCLLGLWSHFRGDRPSPPPLPQSHTLSSQRTQTSSSFSWSGHVFSKDWFDPFSFWDISMHKWPGVFMTCYFLKKEKTCWIFLMRDNSHDKQQWNKLIFLPNMIQVWQAFLFFSSLVRVKVGGQEKGQVREESASLTPRPTSWRKWDTSLNFYTAQLFLEVVSDRWQRLVSSSPQLSVTERIVNSPLDGPWSFV